MAPPQHNVWAPLIGALPLPMTDGIQISQNETLENEWTPALLKTVKVMVGGRSLGYCHNQEEPKAT